MVKQTEDGGFLFSFNDIKKGKRVDSFFMDMGWDSMREDDIPNHKIVNHMLRHPDEDYIRFDKYDIIHYNLKELIKDMKHNRIDFYFGSNFGSANIIKDICSKLTSIGMYPTCEWWEHTGDDKVKYAIDDYNGVKTSDFLLLYNVKKKTTGRLIEVGLALAWEKPVFVFGNPLSGVFGTMTTYCGDLYSVDEIVKEIKGLHKMGILKGKWK